MVLDCARSTTRMAATTSMHAQFEKNEKKNSVTAKMVLRMTKHLNYLQELLDLTKLVTLDSPIYT
jgi:hypothetical protein